MNTWRLFAAILFGFSVLQDAVLQIVGASDPPLLLLMCTGAVAGGFAVRLCSRLTRCPHERLARMYGEERVARAAEYRCLDCGRAIRGA